MYRGSFVHVKFNLVTYTSRTLDLVIIILSYKYGSYAKKYIFACLQIE